MEPGTHFIIRRDFRGQARQESGIQDEYAVGSLDHERYNWLVDELNAGQANNQLMVICAHVPILPQYSLTDTSRFPYGRGRNTATSMCLTPCTNIPISSCGWRDTGT